MRKGILFLMLTILSSHLMAEHYQVAVTNEGSGTRVYQNFGGKKMKYEFSCKGDCEGVLEEQLTAKPGELEEKFEKSKHKMSKQVGDVSELKSLKYSEYDQYISETGVVHEVHKLILKYEKMLQSYNGKKKFEWVGREDADVIYVLTKKGKTYGIDIYTGKDAKEKEHLLKTDK